MDYSSVKVPFLNKSEIEAKAKKFRDRYANNLIPIDIEGIIEFKLGMEIIPIPGLKNNCDTDAFITSNWKAISVDNDSYLKDSYQNRLRFSLAHEIGHFVLHKNIYDTFSINEPEDFYKFISDIPGEQYGYLETQASKFANHLLVPRDILKKEKDKLLKGDSIFEGIGSDTIHSYIAGPLSSIFGVSVKVAEIALSDLR